MITDELDGIHHPDHPPLFLDEAHEKDTFLSNLNFLAWYGSFQLWLTREDKEFAARPFLFPTYNDSQTYALPGGAINMFDVHGQCILLP